MTRGAPLSNNDPANEDYPDEDWPDEDWPDEDGPDEDGPDAAEPASGNPDLRSYGRRRGRKLSLRQQSLYDQRLPALRATAGELGNLEPSPRLRAALQADAPIWLEIGFGGGEHLVWQATHNPGVTIIGCEPFVDGVVKVLTEIDDRSADPLATEAAANAGPKPGAPLGNVILHDDDVRPLLRMLPDACLARAFVLFPDPWPKRRHVKRRLVSASFLRDLARVLKPGGELRVGTDIADYARTILTSVAAVPEFEWPAERATDWTVRPSDWPRTRYEAKAEREGRRSCYFRFRRTG